MTKEIKDKTKCPKCGHNEFYKKCLSSNYYKYENGELENYDNSYDGESDDEPNYYCGSCGEELELIDNELKVIKDVELKTITICKSEHAVFCGSEELKQFIYDNVGCDKEGETFCEFCLDNIKELPYLKDSDLKQKGILKKVKKELDLLIKEMEENDFENLMIE